MSSNRSSHRRRSPVVGWIYLWVMGLALCLFPVVPAAAATPTTGTIQVLVLLVDFSDNVGSASLAGQTPQAYFSSLMFGNYPANAPNGSFKDYYAEVSYGALTTLGQINYGSVQWIRLPKTYSYYVNNNYGIGSYPQNAQKMVADAVGAAKTAGLNFGPYDNDNNGLVDALFVVHAGRGAEFTGCTCDIWSHKWNTAFPINTGSVNALGNTVYVSAYTTEPEYYYSPGDSTIGVFAHEFGHVLGLPDLYDTDYSSEGLGNWSIMAGGSWNGTLGNRPAHPDAWSKIKLGWVTPQVPNTNRTISLPQVETNPTAFKLWTNGAPGQEYFLLENRELTGFDAGLPYPGLLIYHVDDAITTANDKEWYTGCSTCTSHYQVALMQSDNLWELEKKINRGNAGDPYPGSGSKTAFSDTTSPNSRQYSGASTGVSVVKIGPASSTMTADIALNFTTIGSSPASIVFSGEQGGAAPPSQNLSITNTSGGSMAWTASHGLSWLTLSPSSGTAPSTIQASASQAGLSAGSYSGSIVISAPGATNDPLSIPVTLNVTPDVTAPSVSITSPSGGATVSGTIAVAATATDAVGVSRVEFFLDGALKQTSYGSPYTWNWDTTSSANGAHTLTAKAYDAAGNVGISAPVSANVSNTVAADGDVNGDGIVDTADVVLATRIALGKVTPTSSQLAHGDVYPQGAPDGVIDISDIIRITRKVMGRLVF